MSAPELAAACIGGVLSWEGRVVGRGLWGEPLVAAMLTGLWLGAGPEALMIGAVLQLIWLNLLPEGAAVPPDGTVPAIVGTALAASLQGRVSAHPHAVVVSVIAAVLPLGAASRWADIRLREWQRRLGVWTDHYAHHGRPAGIARVVAWAAVVAAVKGAVTCGIPVWVGAALLPKILGTLPPQLMKGMEIAYVFLLPLGLAVALDLFLADREEAVLMVAAFALATAGFVWAGWPRPWVGGVVLGAAAVATAPRAWRWWTSPSGRAG